MKKKSKIFFVEDDLPFGNVLKTFLELNNYVVDWFNDGEKAIQGFKKEIYDIALIDVMLPHVDGFAIAKYIRNKEESLPFVFLTAKSQKEDVLHGYKSGADDYISKPFDTEVLLYKLNAILKRNKIEVQTHYESYKLGSYHFNTEFRQLSHPKHTVTLSPRESEILEHLIQHSNRLVNRSELLVKFWGEDDYFKGRSLDVFIAKLRKYLINDREIELKSIIRSGYVLYLPE